MHGVNFNQWPDEGQAAMTRPALLREVGFEPETPYLDTRSEVRIIRDLKGLDELVHDWDTLAALSGRPMQDFVWTRACAQSFAKAQEMHVVVMGTPSRVTAIAPFIRTHGRLALLGVEELYAPTEFLFADPSTLGTLTRSLARRGEALFLKRVPADSSVVPALRKAYRWRGIVVCRSAAGTPWIPLDAGWLQPELRLTSGRRSALMRARRIAEKIGPVQVELLTPTVAELDALLDEALRVEQAGWTGRTGSALAHDEARGVFYRRYAVAAAEQGILRLCFLRIGGRVAAMQFAVECGERFWLLKIGYDESFYRCSPGMLLILETVRYAASQGLRSYEFLGTDEPWTQMWAPLVRPCLSVAVYPANGGGVRALAADVADVARRKFGRGGV